MLLIGGLGYDKWGGLVVGKPWRQVVRFDVGDWLVREVGGWRGLQHLL